LQIFNPVQVTRHCCRSEIRPYSLPKLGGFAFSPHIDSEPGTRMPFGKPVKYAG
jgi:hypothetical protein